MKGTIKRFILRKLSDKDLKNELKKRGYDIDITINYTVDGRLTELKAICKKPIVEAEVTN